MKTAKKINKLIGIVVNSITNGVSQTSVKKSENTFPWIDGIDALCRNAAAESFVLLKNDNRTLPVKENETVSVFGRVQSDPFFVGYGSGGDVNPHYTVDFMQGLHNAQIHINDVVERAYGSWRKKNPVDNGYWGHWPMCYEEMPISGEFAAEAADNSSVALYFIGRAAGEDRENTLSPGSYYLTETEEKNIRLLTTHFNRVAVILNIGSMIDLSWIDKYSVPCVGICWQGGMEAGNALADIISGRQNPSGKLTDTVAAAYDDYPSSFNFGNKEKNRYEEDIFVGYRFFETFAKDKTLFPFGWGLSYTDFEILLISFSEQKEQIILQVKVKNAGKCSGREVVQVYFGGRFTAMYMPERQLITFEKTPLIAPDESVELTFTIRKAALAAYDDTGASGYKNALVLPEGRYEFYLGNNVRDAVTVGSFRQQETVCVRSCTSVLPPSKSEQLCRLRPLYRDGRIIKTFEPVPGEDERVIVRNLHDRILHGLPAELSEKTSDPVTLQNVKQDPSLLDTFIAQLSFDELEALSRGDYVMNSPLGPKGNAGVFGGVTASLRQKGLAPVTTTDGPSGIRLAATSALLPSGTALACTWNPELVRTLYAALGKELKDRSSDVLLAPGMNIHRNPLCGRNFEYFSEDPLLSGKMAAAVVSGLKDSGVNGCPKHFACNNQELNRTKNNSIVSERALREIYLKGFEICVKEASPDVLMTSYNKINGVWGHYQYPLVTEILRKEWNYDGLVITDWWMQPSRSPEFPQLKDQAYRVRAGVDVLMPGGNRIGKKKPDGTLLHTLNKPEGISLGELQATAKHVIAFALKTDKIIIEKEHTKNESNEL